MTTADKMPATDTTIPKNGQAHFPADGPAVDAADAMLCPRCGFDLRGTASDRCGECGLAFDRADLGRSGVPWAHRRRIGRFRAFVKTVWLLTTDRPRVRHELAKPQAAGDALWFQGWVAGCVAAALLVAAAAAEHRYGITGVVVEYQGRINYFYAGPSWFQRGGPWIGVGQDLTVPWSAGLTLLPVPIACLVGLALYSVGVGRATLRLRRHPPEHRRRAWAVARYAAAPLVLLLPAAAAYGVAEIVRHAAERSDDRFDPGFTVPPNVLRSAAGSLAWAAAGVAAVGGLLVVHRWGEWNARAHYGGVGRYAVGLAEVLGRAVLGWVLFLGVGPWCVGLLRIIVASWP